MPPTGTLASCIAAAALLTLSACSSQPLAVEMPDEPRPSRDEYKNLARYEEKEFPGIRYWHKARVAYAKYLQFKREQEELFSSQNPNRAAIPEEYFKERKDQNLSEAQENLEKFFDLNRDFALSHQVMGLIHIEREEYDKALARFAEVLRIDPLADNAWVNIAYVHWRQGNTNKAKEALSRALEINPTSAPAARLRDTIEEEELQEAARKAREEIPPFRPDLDR